MIRGPTGGSRRRELQCIAQARAADPEALNLPRYIDPRGLEECHGGSKERDEGSKLGGI